LRLDDKPIASIFLFKLNGVYFPWKITFDSIYSKYSPGSQLMVRLSQDICAKPDFEYADSLAMYGQSWMTMLWPDTLSFKRLILAKDNQTSEAIERSFEVKSGLKNFIRKFLPRPGRTHPSNSHLK